MCPLPPCSKPLSNPPIGSIWVRWWAMVEDPSTNLASSEKAYHNARQTTPLATIKYCCLILVWRVWNYLFPHLRISYSQVYQVSMWLCCHCWTAIITKLSSPSKSSGWFSLFRCKFEPDAFWKRIRTSIDSFLNYTSSLKQRQIIDKILTKYNFCAIFITIIGETCS